MESVPRKRVTIFLGAGASIPWGGPTSLNIEQIFSSDPRFLTTQNRPVADHMFKLLRDYYGNKESVNFETFLSLLERILEFCLDENSTGGTNANTTSFSPLIYDIKIDLIQEISDYIILDSNPKRFNDEGREIVNFKSPKRGGNSSSQEFLDAIKSIYFSKLLRYFMSRLLYKITSYDNQYNSNRNISLNKSFLEWIDFFIDRNYIVRIYTSNYDRWPLKILREKHTVFDGFSDYESKDYNYAVKPESKRILSDYECLNYYNIHGSVYWEREFLLSPLGHQFICKPNQPNTYETYITREQGNPGESLVMTNIVTGYNKSQRVNYPPLNFMRHAFENDIVNSNLIITVGSSFSDPHLNNSLSLASAIKPVHWINIGYTNGNYLSSEVGKKFMKIVQSINKDDFTDSTFYEHWIVNSNNKIAIFKNGFERYLRERQWTKILH